MQGLGNRYSQHSFAQIPSVNSERSVFDRSFPVKTTFNFDYLVPIFWDEVIPGDTKTIRLKTFARLATQAVPLMDNMMIDFFSFFVPTRLVWNHWEQFNGYQENPGDSTDFLMPRLNTASGAGRQVVTGDLFDQLGLPPGSYEAGANDWYLRADVARSYNLIWNEWFRDQNLQNRVGFPKDDGPDNWTNYKLLKRGKRHDYFTSALPFPQKGPAVELPLGQKAPVYGDQINFSGGVYTNAIGLQSYTSAGVRRNDGYGLTEDVAGVLSISGFGDTAANAAWNITRKDGINQSHVYADLTDATAATINQLRQAIMLQSLLELDARGGTRYVELLRAHFKVVSPDFRLQRPELLSASSTRINQHVVAQTSETNETPLANLGAYSTQSGQEHSFSKSFDEHGIIITLACARGDISYQQGINRMWMRRTRWDFFWPKLQELGEQAVMTQELYKDAPQTEVLGYQERYAEYRYRPAEIKGQFRSQYAETLDVWHLAEYFATKPSLNATFIQQNTPIERSLEVTSPNYPHLLFDAFIDYKDTRPMMQYGVPATLGRF